jgi:antitoxin component HigA of HigAB toxin-antitoxin module
MKTLQEIRDELKMIREYHFALFSAGNGAEILVPNDIARLMESYSRAVQDAPKPVRRAYRGLYERGCTQKALAVEWGVTEKYVQILNKRLLLYLQKVKT